MLRSPRSWSFVGVFIAAAASVATSAPPPDWTRDDATTGVVALSPDAEETVFRVRVSSRAVDSSLSIGIAADPAPERGAKLTETPIAFFVGVPTEVADAGSTDVRLRAFPTFNGPAPDGFESMGGTSTPVPIGSEGRVYEVRIAWTSPFPEDKIAHDTSYDAGKFEETKAERTLAPRRPLKIRWQAKLHAEGYDDAPSGAGVDVEPAQ